MSTSNKLLRCSVSTLVKEDPLRLSSLQCTRFLESNYSIFLTTASSNLMSYSFNLTVFATPMLTVSALCILAVSNTSAGAFAGILSVFMGTPQSLKNSNQITLISLTYISIYSSIIIFSR